MENRIEEISEQKKMLRNKIKDINKLHLPDERETLSVLAEKIFSIKEFIESEIVLSFASSGYEVNTDLLNKKIMKSGKKLALPRVIKNTQQMNFYFIDEALGYDEQLEKGAFDIREPYESIENIVSDKKLCGKKIFVIVPGVAFDLKNKRLGHGKGFYDIYLSKLKQNGIELFLCGLCFNWQLVKEIPCDETDIIMDKVIAL